MILVWYWWRVKVPVIFLSIQRWAEFAKTWQFSDENKNIKMPFITIVRKPDAQVGTNYAGDHLIFQVSLHLHI